MSYLSPLYTYLEFLTALSLRVCLLYLHILQCVFKQLQAHISFHNTCTQHNDHSLIFVVVAISKDLLLFLELLLSSSFTSSHFVIISFELSISEPYFLFFFQTEALKPLRFYYLALINIFS